MRTHLGRISTAAGSGRASTARDSEQEALARLIDSLNHAIVAGASFDAIARVLDATAESFQWHCDHQQDAPNESDAAIHAALRHRLQETRERLASGCPDAPLDVLDLLHLLDEHSRTFGHPVYGEALQHRRQFRVLQMAAVS